VYRVTFQIFFFFFWRFFLSENNSIYVGGKKNKIKERERMGLKLEDKPLSSLQIPRKGVLGK
jgi:hypothetical protein